MTYRLQVSAMRILLLEDFKGRKAGREWDCPFAALGRQLIEAGTALAVEECDLHLNPVPAVAGGAAVGMPMGLIADTTEADAAFTAGASWAPTFEPAKSEQPAAEEPAAPPAPQPKPKRKK